MLLGTNCYSLFTNQDLKVDTEYLKHIARGILIGLDYLHRNNVVHKDLRESCIYINDCGKLIISIIFVFTNISRIFFLGTVVISNYSIHRRLLDLCSQGHCYYNKKTDIFKFGLLILSLLQGYTISEENVEIPSIFSSDLYDFLSRYRFILFSLLFNNFDIFRIN